MEVEKMELKTRAYVMLGDNTDSQEKNMWTVFVLGVIGGISYI